MNTNNPFDFFDKIYCISLPNQLKRKKHMEVEFEKVGILERINWIYAVPPPKSFKIDLYRRNPSAEFGCSLSQITAIVDAINQQAENVLIFEDDVKFSDFAVKKLSKAISHLPPSWIGFYLGCTPGGNTIFNDDIIKTKGWWTWGAYAYALNGNSLIDFFNAWTYGITHAIAISQKNHRNAYSPFDAILSEFINKNDEGYAISPPIVIPANTIKSTIDNKKYNSTMHDKHWKKEL